MSSRAYIPTLDRVQCTRSNGCMEITSTGRIAGEQITLFERQTEPKEIIRALERWGLVIADQQALLLKAAQTATSHDATKLLIEAADMIGETLTKLANTWRNHNESVAAMPPAATKNTTVMQNLHRRPLTVGSDGSFLPPKPDPNPALRIKPPKEGLLRNAREPQILRAIGERLVNAGLIAEQDGHLLPQALGYRDIMPDRCIVWLGHKYELRHMVVRLKALGWLPTEEGRGHSLWNKICNVFCLPPSANGKPRELDANNLRTAVCHNNGAYDRVDKAVHAAAHPADNSQHQHSYNPLSLRHNQQATQTPSCPT